MAVPITLDEVESLAKTKLPKYIYDFYASGSDEQEALARNRDAFKKSVTSALEIYRRVKRSTG